MQDTFLTKSCNNWNFGKNLGRNLNFAIYKKPLSPRETALKMQQFLSPLPKTHLGVASLSSCTFLFVRIAKQLNNFTFKFKVFQQSSQFWEEVGKKNFFVLTLFSVTNNSIVKVHCLLCTVFNFVQMRNFAFLSRCAYAK